MIEMKVTTTSQSERDTHQQHSMEITLRSLAIVWLLIHIITMIVQKSNVESMLRGIFK